MAKKANPEQTKTRAAKPARPIKPTRPTKPARPIKTAPPPKPVRPARPAKPVEYKGMRLVSGRSRPAQRAIDGLIEFLRSLMPSLPAHGEIKLHGSHMRVVRDNDDARTKIDVWRVYEVSTWVPDPEKPGAGGGSSIMRSDPGCLGIVVACEEFLETFGVKPQKVGPGPEDVIDDHADARRRLEYQLRLPSASKAQAAIAFLLWYEKQYHQVPLASALDARANGFYDHPIREDLERLVGSMPEDERRLLHDRFEAAAKAQPSRVWELTLKGWDENDANTDHLVKWVQASKTGLDEWLARSGLGQHLIEPPRDLAEGAKDPERVLRYTFEDGLDLLVSDSGGPTHDESVHLRFTQKDLTLSPGYDPAPDWIRQSGEVLARQGEGDPPVARPAPPDGYERPEDEQAGEPHHPEYERASRELQEHGDAPYKGFTIRASLDDPVYVVIGHGQYDTLDEALRACDRVYATLPQDLQEGHDAGGQGDPDPAF